MVNKILSELYKRIIIEGIKLHISDIFFSNNKDGAFSAKRCPHTTSPRIILKIQIFRSHGFGTITQENAEERSSQSNDPKNELMVLAHEYGHFLSYKNEDRTKEYDNFIQKNIPEKDWATLHDTLKQIILNEEKIAWNYAEKILTDIGFSDWHAFKTKRFQALKEYSMRLRVSE